MDNDLVIETERFTRYDWINALSEARTNLANEREQTKELKNRIDKLEKEIHITNVLVLTMMPLAKLDRYYELRNKIIAIF